MANWNGVPIRAVLDAVEAPIGMSSRRALLLAVPVEAPLLMKMYALQELFVPRGTISVRSTRAPLAPAVNRVETVPVPSVAVFAVSEGVTKPITGVSGKIGFVLAARPAMRG